MSKNNEQAACNGDQHEDPVDNMDEEAAAKEKLTADPNQVKFTTVNLDAYDGKNGEAKVDIYVAQTTVGMGKEELMKYANEPFWVRLRMFLFVFFWIAWIAMLVGAIVIILLAPRCPPAPRLDWYQRTAMYQVDVDTFKDSDGDGVGDFKGLISKLQYFKTQNIGTLMLSAFYKSSDSDDSITDHTEIDNKLGTIADFEDLLTQLNEKDIKLVIDFNPNHSSDQHQWFLDSVEGKEPYKDYYIWVDIKNNWLNIDGESAWTYNDQRKQYYLGTFGKTKPDLNLRNENVREELKNILKFWLEKGVHGFKVVAASHLVEDQDLKDEALSTVQSVRSPKYQERNHLYTVDQPENLGLFAEWRDILANFTESTGLRKILLAEVSGSIHDSMLYYGNDTYTLAELPINSQLTTMNDKSTGLDLKEAIDMLSKNTPDGAWPTLLVGSKSNKRLASRVGDDLVDGMHMVTIIAKGTPIMYYGDELGMVDLENPSPSGNMISPSAMLWSNETNAGFSTGSGSIQVHPDYENVNVETQEKDKHSHLNIFKRLLALRGQPAVSFGLQEYPIANNETFSMIRVRKGSPGYLVVINFSSSSTTIDFTGTSGYLPDVARVEIRSKNLVDGRLTDGDHPKIGLSSVPLGAKQAVVFSFVPHFEG